MESYRGKKLAIVKQMKAPFLSVIALIMLNGASSKLYCQTMPQLLKAGDNAPSLYIQEWLKGTPIEQFDGNGIYVVEFSATWCAPCRKAIPHLTEIARKFNGEATIVSIYIDENNDKDTINLTYVDRVRRFVEMMGAKMQFTVAVDVARKTTMSEWRVKGIPRAIVVKDRKVLWNGSPSELEPVLTDIISGRFNPKVAENNHTKYDQKIQAILTAKKQGEHQFAFKAIDSLIKARPQQYQKLYYLKFNLLKGADDKRAYEWVQWMLEARVKDFEWPDVIFGFSDIDAGKRDYDIELRAIDRAIEESETVYLTSQWFCLKAEIYLKMEDYKNAIKNCELAIETSKAPGNYGELQTKNYEKRLIHYKYLQLAATDVAAANNLMKSYIESETLDFSPTITESVMEVSKRDVEFTIYLLNYYLMKQNLNKGQLAWLLSKKAEVFVNKQDYHKAIDLYQQALDHNNESGGFADRTKEYETRLIEVKQKLGP